MVVPEVTTTPKGQTTVTVTTTTVTTLPAGSASVNVKAKCTQDGYIGVNDETQKKVGFAFCYKLAAGKYSFSMALSKGKAWGAVGTNAVGKMSGTQLMRISLVKGAPTITYMGADNGFGMPTAVAKQPDDAACTTDVAQGIVCEWTRAADEVWPEDLAASALTYIIASRNGDFTAAFEKHDFSSSLSKLSGTAFGGKATKGNLAHGVIFFLAMQAAPVSVSVCPCLCARESVPVECV